MKLLRKHPVLITAIPTFLVLWTLMVLVLTLTPAESLPETRIFSYDKIGHFGMFGGWTGLLGLSHFYYKKNVDVNLFSLMFYGIIFGIAIELLQLILPINRSFSWFDIIANSLGCVTAYFVLNKIKSRYFQ